MKLRLKEIRKEQHITQKELASLLSVSPAQISRYETGKAELSSDLIIKISNILSVSTDELLGNKPLSLYPLRGDSSWINESDVAPEIMNTALSQLGEHLRFLNHKLESLQEAISYSQKQLETLTQTETQIIKELQVLSSYYKNLENLYQNLSSTTPIIPSDLIE